MKSKSLLWIITAFAMLCCTAYAASAFDYFTYRMNFEPGNSENHLQEMTFSGNLTIILPGGFSFVSSTYNYTTSGSNYTWQSAVETTINYTISSPASCTEGDIYRSKIYNNGLLIDEFVYVCIDDEKIVDYKVEYGHGCGNYLSKDEPYIPNESAALFNLVRVWNIGNYLDPDEDAEDAAITCFYENYPVRTYGRVDVGYGAGINGTFEWDIIYGGYWFRIGVLSQEVSGKSVGDVYGVNCTELTYDFSHQRVVASFPNYTLNVRSPEPLSKNAIITGTKEIVTIKNIEQYPVYNVYIDYKIDNVAESYFISKLDAGETATYYADANSNTTASYIPSWQRHCFAPVYYQQVLTNVSNATIDQCPSAKNIPSQAWAENTSNNNAFDLDDYFTDPENGSLAYSYSGTLSINVTINPATHAVSFTQPSNFTGIEYVVFSADDGSCITYSNNVTLVVYPANVTVAGNATNGTTLVEVTKRSRRTVYVYLPVNVTPEKECREIWLCTEWSECYAGGYKTRECSDANKCNATGYKPSTIEDCIPGAGAPPEEEKPAPAGEMPAAECRICSIAPFALILLFMLFILLILPERKEK